MQHNTLLIESVRAFIPVRALGAVGMLCSPMLYFASLFFSPDPDAPNPNQLYATLFAVLYLSGAMATATAMRWLRVTGRGTGAVVLYVVQMVGLLLAMTSDVLGLAGPGLRQSTLFFAVDMAYPFSHLLFLVVGVAVVRAGVWRGWRRVPAFLVGAALPSFFGLLALTGRENAGFIFPALVTVGFFLLGYAVRTTKQKQCEADW